jgi:transposase
MLIAIFVYKKLLKCTNIESKYLLSYSSNYNLIELSFSILKTWLKRHFHESWFYFEETFEDFLKYAINKDECDRFVKEHFKHSIEIKEDNIFQNDIEALNEQLHRD